MAMEIVKDTSVPSAHYKVRIMREPSKEEDSLIIATKQIH